MACGYGTVDTLAPTNLSGLCWIRNQIDHWNLSCFTLDMKHYPGEPIKQTSIIFGCNELWWSCLEVSRGLALSYNDFGIPFSNPSWQWKVPTLEVDAFDKFDNESVILVGDLYIKQPVVEKIGRWCKRESSNNLGYCPPLVRPRSHQQDSL